VALADLVEVAVTMPGRRIGAVFRLNRRGGDPCAEQRRRRDKAVCALHALTGKDKPLEPWAREVAQKLARFQPMPEETSPERRLMREIVEPGLPIGPRRIKEIVAKQ
jgi:hypothetical protein